MCVFPNLSRSVGGYENHQNARAHFSRRGIVIHLLIFHFFLSPMTGAFAKSSRKRSFFAALSKTAAWGERVNEKIYCRITPAVKSRYYSVNSGTLVVNLLFSSKYIIKCRL